MAHYLSEFNFFCFNSKSRKKCVPTFFSHNETSENDDIQPPTVIFGFEEN